MIKTIQIGIDPKVKDIQFVIDIEKIGSPKMVGDLLKFSIENSVVIGQNLKYEYQFLFVHMGIRLRECRDIMLMSQVLKAGDKLSHSLENLYARYMDGAIFKQLTTSEEHPEGLSFIEYSAYKKESQKSNWRGDLTVKQLIYAADDVRLPYYVYELICDEIDDFIQVYETHNQRGQTIVNAILLECALVGIYAMMEIRGVELDVAHHTNAVIEFLEAKKKEANEAVGKWFTHQVKKTNGLRGKLRETWFETETINIGSVKQLREALASVGIPMPESGGTDAESLSKFRLKHDSIPWILTYKKASSLLSKFGEKLIKLCSSKNVLHANWYQIGSDDSSIDTGRSSCKEPNLQQIPNRDDDNFESWGTTASKMFRRSFVARKGKVLIDADYGQVEPRLQAELCNEVSQIEAFQEAEITGDAVDTHALTAKAAFGLSYIPTKKYIEDMKKAGNDAKAGEAKRMRDTGKILNLGIGYGMGAAKLARNITEETGKATSTQDARKIIDAYYANLPGIKAMKTKVEREVKRRAESCETLAVFAGRKPISVQFTTLGRPRRWCLKTSNPDQEAIALADPQQLSKWYDDPNSGMNIYQSRLSEASREAFNFKIQGCCADILKQSLVYIQKEFDEAGFDSAEEGILMVVHDEVVAEVNKEHEQLGKHIVERCMLRAAREVLKEVPVEVEIHTGPNWAEVH